jgi:hypothetical protein
MHCGGKLLVAQLMLFDPRMTKMYLMILICSVITLLKLSLPEIDQAEVCMRHKRWNEVPRNLNNFGLLLQAAKCLRVNN